MTDLKENLLDEDENENQNSNGFEETISSNLKNSDNSNTLVLVTGASGFIAGHVVKILLQRKYKVRGTVRSLSNKKKYQYLYNLDPTNGKLLELVEGDLTIEKGWDDNVKGCDYIIHTANPMPDLEGSGLTREQQIQPAINGMIYIMDAAHKHKIKKVVYTSSVSSMRWVSQGGSKTAWADDKTWTDIDDPRTSAYAVSKTLSEKKGWELAKKYNIPFTTIHPSMTMGPILSGRKPDSCTPVLALLNNWYPRLPDMGFTISDVRDVGLAHVNALENKISDGNRYIISNTNLWLDDIAKILQDKYGNTYKITRTAGAWSFFKFVSFFNPVVKTYVLPAWGVLRLCDNTMSVNHLKVVYIPVNQTIGDMADHLIANNFVKSKPCISSEQILNTVKYLFYMGVLGGVGYLAYRGFG